MRTRISAVGIAILIGFFATSTFAGELSDVLSGKAEFVTTQSGLQYVDLTAGTGKQAQKGDMATIHYTGWFENGEKFDSSLDRGEPYSFLIGSRMVIEGWNEGVTTMKKGGKRKLIIPPHLGFGSDGARKGAIPPNATLTFEVELLNLK